MRPKRPKSKSAFKDAQIVVEKVKNSLDSGENISIIPLDLIYSPKTHDRQCYSDEEIEELALSIKTSGLLQPIVVRRVGDKFERLIGFKRVKAMQMNQEESIKAIVLENIDDKEAALITISENLFRSDPNPYDQTLAFLDYICVALKMNSEDVKKLLYRKKTSDALNDEDALKISEIENLLLNNLSIKLRTFTDRLRMLTMNTILIEAIQKREISYNVALLLNSINKDNELKNILNSVVEKGLTLTEIKKLLNKSQSSNYKKESTTLSILSSKYKKSISSLDEKKQKKVNEYLLKIDEILKSNQL